MLAAIVFLSVSFLNFSFHPTFHPTTGFHFTTATAAETPAYTDKNKLEAAALVHELLTKQISSDAEMRYLKSVVKEMGKFRFNEVVEALFVRLDHEIKAVRPTEERQGKKQGKTGGTVSSSNMELIVEILNSIQRVALPDSHEELRSLKAAFDSKAATVITAVQASWVTDVNTAFSKTEAEIINNKHVLLPIGETIMNQVANYIEAEVEEALALATESGDPEAVVEVEENSSSELIKSGGWASTPTFLERIRSIATQDNSKMLKDFVGMTEEDVTATAKVMWLHPGAEVIGRDDLSNKVIDTLARMNRPFPTLTGPSFSGKTSVARKAAFKLLSGDYPNVDGYQQRLANTVVVRVSAMAFGMTPMNPVGKVDFFFEVLRSLRYEYNFNVVPLITDLDSFNDSGWAVMEKYLLEAGACPVIFEADDAVLTKLFKDIPRAKGLLQTINVEAMNNGEVLEVLKGGAIPYTEKKFGVNFSDDGLASILDQSRKKYGESGAVSAAGKMLEDIAIQQTRQGQANVEITAEVVRGLQAAEKHKSNDPYADQNLMSRLSTLLQYMNNRVYGWEETNEAIFDAIFAHQTTPAIDQKAPLSIFIVGSTGTGKSETAKSIAAHLFGSDDKALVLNMGAITNEGHANKLFGAPPQYVGYGEITQLERFIMENEKTGAVILWDEVSNMGGSDPKVKNALFKILYDMVEEGKWTPPHKSTPYDLSKFIFIFTGNDGEQLFSGVSADEMRMAIWKSNNKKETLKQMLREAGIPEAFIGRMADLILAKPLTLDSMKKITLKFLNPIIESYKVQGLNVTYDDSLLLRFAETFFAQSTGARSVRSVFEMRLKSFIAQAHWFALEKGYKGKPMNLRFELSDNLPSSAFIDDLTYRRKVVIKVILESEGQVVKEIERDVTDFAPKRTRLSKQQAVTTAVHEAGHAATNDPEISQQKLRFLTIMGADDMLGYAGYEKLSEDVYALNGTRAVAVSNMARMLAGQRAAQLAGFSPDEGWSSDIEKARRTAYHHLVVGGDPEHNTLLALPVSEDGKPMVIGKAVDVLLKQMEKMMAEADEMAVRKLQERWSLVVALQNRLLQAGSFSGEEFEKIKAEVAKDKTEWVLGPEGRMIKADDPSNSLLRRGVAMVMGRKSSIPVVNQRALPKLTFQELAAMALTEAGLGLGDVTVEDGPALVEPPKRARGIVVGSAVEVDQASHSKCDLDLRGK